MLLHAWVVECVKTYVKALSCEDAYKEVFFYGLRVVLVCPLRCGDQAVCWCDVLVGICGVRLVLTYSVTYLVKYSVTYLMKYMVMYLPRGGRLKA
ncbi:hypothetical protein F2Q69_00022322 [Brassica cretica]|uniref:Uncharacterized protein n=1 Tax=Brassica cretica TaxID=69181 RepID=A0A8S9Q660_BRACR|nr:hypothetical protein F2Q69_00022322 [Brassica cretica]